MKHLLIAAAAVAMIPAAAQAQDNDLFNGGYVGLQGVYHDLDNGIDGGLLGGYVGFNAPVGGSIVLGLEGNFNFGISGDLDSDYGVSAHVGVRAGDAGLVFLRAGYQEVNFNLPDDLDDVPGVDDNDGGFLLGVGGEFGVSSNASVRATLDTIEFDTLRIGAGVTFHF